MKHSLESLNYLSNKNKIPKSVHLVIINYTNRQTRFNLGVKNGIKYYTVKHYIKFERIRTYGKSQQNLFNRFNLK